MLEIGGYIELDIYRLPMLHENAVALNCGRNALAYLFRVKGIKKIWLPIFICDSIIDVCNREGVTFSYYRIGMDFFPAQGIPLEKDEWVFFINYYSQFNNERIAGFVRQYQRVIVDNTQSYFQEALPGIDTIYTCRKYFGVPDGAFLYSETRTSEPLPIDISFDRMRFLLGRFEQSASGFYAEYCANNEFFSNEPIKRMSKLTKNLLHGIDYELVKKTRSENFAFLHDRLGQKNKLILKQSSSFMYPFMVENGIDVRKRLLERKIYIPVLWPTVFSLVPDGDIEYLMAENILPLPIDQRYGKDTMEYVLRELEKCID